jgi:hypothetical protein
VSRYDLPKPPPYEGEDPQMAALFAWAQDITDALQRALSGMDSRMVRKGDPVELPLVTVAQLAAFRFRATQKGRLVYVTNETGGEVPAFADGTAFRRVTDRGVVS